MARPLIIKNVVCVLVLVVLAIAEATPPGIANNPSHARCLIKKYKMCYNLEHVCPKFCPSSCTVECVSCKPICTDGSTPPPPDTEANPPPSTSPPDHGSGAEGKGASPPENDQGKSPPPSEGDKGGHDGKGAPPPENDHGDGKSPPPSEGDSGKGHGKGTPPESSPPPKVESPPPPVVPVTPSPSPPATPTPTPSSAPTSPPPSSSPQYSPPQPTTPSQTPPTSPPPTPATPKPSPPLPTPSPPSVPPTPSSPSPSSPPWPSPTPPPSPSPTPNTPPTPVPSIPGAPPPESPGPEANPHPKTHIPPPPPPFVPVTPSPSSPTPSPPISTPPTSPTPPPSISLPPPAPYWPPPSPGDSSEAAAGRRKRCKNRNYPQCYGVEHVCPSSCPNTCEVDCVTCKPVCKCDMPGAVCQDPRFIGGDGITFYFHGKKDKDFCLVTEPNFQINAHFIGKRNENMKRDFTWVQSIAILFGDHQLLVGTQKTATWDDAVDRFSLSFDGEAILLSAAEGSTWQSATATIKRDSGTNSVIIEVEGLFKISAKVVPITKHESEVHNYGITEEDCFAHLELGFKFFSLSATVNGVLGQTYGDNYVSRAKMGVAMPVLGGEREFAVSNIFATDCAVSQFHGGKISPENYKATVLELPSMKCGSGIDRKGVVCKR